MERDVERNAESGIRDRVAIVAATLMLAIGLASGTALGLVGGWALAQAEAGRLGPPSSPASGGLTAAPVPAGTRAGSSGCGLPAGPAVPGQG